MSDFGPRTRGRASLLTSPTETGIPWKTSPGVVDRRPWEAAGRLEWTWAMAAAEEAVVSALERAPGAVQVSMMVREASTAASWPPARAGRQPAAEASSSSPWRRARAATGRPGAMVWHARRVDSSWC